MSICRCDIYRRSWRLSKIIRNNKLIQQIGRIQSQHTEIHSLYLIYNECKKKKLTPYILTSKRIKYLRINLTKEEYLFNETTRCY